MSSPGSIMLFGLTVVAAVGPVVVVFIQGFEKLDVRTAPSTILDYSQKCIIDSGGSGFFFDLYARTPFKLLSRQCFAEKFILKSYSSQEMWNKVHLVGRARPILIRIWLRSMSNKCNERAINVMKVQSIGAFATSLNLCLLRNQDLYWCTCILQYYKTCGT